MVDALGHSAVFRTTVIAISFMINMRSRLATSAFTSKASRRCTCGHQWVDPPFNIHRRLFHQSVALFLNRILFDSSEIDTDCRDGAFATVTIQKDDYRTIHVAKILGLRNGDRLRVGSVRSPVPGENLLEGILTDDATITWLPEGKVKKSEPTKNGEPPGSLLISIPHPPKTSLWKDRNHEDGGSDSSDTPPVSLLLALPRPLQLGRILPMVAQLGIDQLILTNAAKVPKDYFGSHIFRKPEVLRGLLVEGLTQCGDLRLPNVTVTNRLKIFMEDELDDIFPPEEVLRVIAHPERKSVLAENKEDIVTRLTDVGFPNDESCKRRRILVAVGPEGGWDEPHELDMFINRGFQKVSLGSRVLRSDVAVVSLLALANDVCSKSRTSS